MTEFNSLGKYPAFNSEFYSSIDAITGKLRNLGSSIPASPLSGALLTEGRPSTVIESSSQSRQLEELNQKVSDALVQVTKLREELAAAKQQAGKQAAMATGHIEDARNEFTASKDAMSKDLNSLQERLGATISEVSKSQLKLIETLGLFVAVFGFIALSANALKDVQNANMLGGGLLISAGLIMSFVIALDLIVRRWHYDLEAKDVGGKAMLLKWLGPQGVLLLFVVGILMWGSHLLAQGNGELKNQTKPATTPAVRQPPASAPITTPTSTPGQNPVSVPVVTPPPEQKPASTTDKDIAE